MAAVGVGVIGVVTGDLRPVAASLIAIGGCATVAAMFAYRATVEASNLERRASVKGREMLHELHSTVDDAVARIDRLGAGFGESRSDLADLRRYVDDAAVAASERDDSVAAGHRQLRRAVNATNELIDARIPGSVEASLDTALAKSPIPDQLRALRHETVTEVDALLQLHHRFGTAEPTPLVWGWAMSPRGILQLVDLVTECGRRRIVECGPGTSTIYLGRALQQVGSGRITGLEHSPPHAEATRAMISRLGLGDVVEIRLAELVEVPVAGHMSRWYDPSCLGDMSDVDLLVVDGPPGKGGELARLPALAQATAILADDATIVLDDTNRLDEQTIAELWSSDPRVTRTNSVTPDQTIFRWRAGVGRLRAGDGPQLS